MKKITGALFIFVFSLVVTGTLSHAAKRIELGLAGAGPASLAYTLVAGVAENTNTKTKMMRITPETSAGFVQNVRLLGRGETELALIGGTQLYQGMRGIGPYKGEKPYKDIRGLAVAYGGNLSWNGGKGINSISDFAGKTVSGGPPGSFLDYMGTLMLNSYGLKGKVKILQLSYAESARAFVDGTVDGFMGGPAPYPSVLQAGAQRKIKILEVDREHIKKIQKEAPVIVDYVKAGLYEWHKKDVMTIGYLAYLAAHKSVSNDVAYEFLKVNLSPKGIKYLKMNHRLWNMWNTKMYIEEKDAFRLEKVKLHPGAVRYWKEKGVKLPSYLLP